MVYQHLVLNGSYLVAMPEFINPPVKQATSMPAARLPAGAQRQLARAYAAKSRLSHRWEPGRGVIWL